MGSDFTIGYMNYIIVLLLLTGGLILLFDVRDYAASGMFKEKQSALFMGWGNIVLGILLFIGNWVYKIMDL